MLKLAWRAEKAAQGRLQSATCLRPFALGIHFLAREIGLTCCLIAFLFGGSGFSWCSTCFLLLSVGELANGALKFVVREPRPLWNLSCTSDSGRGSWERDYSFPSSHSQVLFGVSLAFWWRWPESPWRVPLTLLCLAGGLSRAYLGQHHLHDVVAGWLVEAPVAWAVLGGVERVMNGSDVAAQASVSLALLCWPLVLEALKRLVPDHPPEVIAAWEKRAREVTGCRSKTLSTRDTSSYYVHCAWACAIVSVRSVVSWSPRLSALLCEPCTTPRSNLVYALRLLLGVPPLLFMASVRRLKGIGNLLILLTALWTLLVSFLLPELFGLTCH